MDSRTSHERATSFPTHAPQEVHSLGTPAEGLEVVLPGRRLDRLRVPTNEGVLVEVRTAGFAQQWQNLLGVCRSSRILRSGVLLKWECHKDAHSLYNQKQETRSKEGCRQPAGEGGHRARPQQPLPVLLQQAVSCSQEDQRSSSCDRPVHSDPTSSDPPFPDGDGADSQGCSPSGWMDGV